MERRKMSYPISLSCHLRAQKLSTHSVFKLLLLTFLVTFDHLFYLKIEIIIYFIIIYFITK
jgi:hypothetical protein